MILKILIGFIILGPFLAMLYEEMKRVDKRVKEEEMLMDREEQ